MKRGIKNLYHVVSTNINTNKVNDIIENELEFDSSNSLANNNVKYPLPIASKMLKGGKKSRQTLNSGLTLLWDSEATNRMVKRNHINPYNTKLMDNKDKYSTYDGWYKTTHDVKVTFRMSEFSFRKIITYCFHVDNM